MQLFTKDSLIAALREVRGRGWIESTRQGNDGGVGNTLEDQLGIAENNLAIPNAAEWELKAQRKTTSSMVTLFHCEPSPRACRFVPQILLPRYGWKHDKAGSRYPSTEMSFRQTISAKSRTLRGFQLLVDDDARKICVSFDSHSVGAECAEWRQDVDRRVGLGELDPQPYWGFDDLFHKLGTKLFNCFLVTADCKKEGRREYFNYSNIKMLSRISMGRFVHGRRRGRVLVDFDARTGHNHGTKFRVQRDWVHRLYEISEDI